MMVPDLKALAERCISTSQTLKQLAHPLRLQLLCHLSMGSKSVRELEELCEAAQSQISQFLGKMKSEGLLRASREGKFVHYSIRDPKLLKLIRALHQIYCP